MQKTMSRMLIETSVRNALARCEESPERATRNLVDLGLNFSNGRFQKRLLTTIQRMLANQDSAYYPLIRDVLENVDSERLLRFGVNLGYEGCTLGARTIRAVEAEHDFNVPWALSLVVDGSLPERLPRYGQVIRQGLELGIHTFLLKIEGDPACAASLPLLAEDGAFVLFLEGRQITRELVDALRPVQNILVVVRSGPEAERACARLRLAQFPYGVYARYRSAGGVLDEAWFAGILPLHPILAFLVPERGCPRPDQQEVYRRVCALRNEQRYPVVPIELKRDLLWIDKMISDDDVMAVFDSRADLHTGDGPACGPDCNVFRADLPDIFHRALAKRAALSR